MDNTKHYRNLKIGQHKTLQKSKDWATQNNIQKSKDWVTQNTIQKSKDWATQPNKKNGGKHVFQNGSQVPAPPLEAPFNVEILPFMYLGCYSCGIGDIA